MFVEELSWSVGGAVTNLFVRGTGFVVVFRRSSSKRSDDASAIRSPGPSLFPSRVLRGRPHARCFATAQYPLPYSQYIIPFLRFRPVFSCRPKRPTTSYDSLQGACYLRQSALYPPADPTAFYCTTKCQARNHCRFFFFAYVPYMSSNDCVRLPCIMLPDSVHCLLAAALHFSLSTPSQNCRLEVLVC